MPTAPRRRGWRPSKERPSAYERGYDYEWHKLREWHLTEEPLCRRCVAEGKVVVADVVDHIVPIEIAPERRLDPENLQSLCNSHHTTKTNEDKRLYGGRIDGRPWKRELP